MGKRHHRWTRKLVRGVGVSAAMTLGWSGCGVEEPEPSPADERIAESDEALMSAGMERLIPIRFSVFDDCVPGPCVSRVSDSELYDAVNVSNRVFAAAGVQFYLDEIARFDVPEIEETMYEIDPATNARIFVPFWRVEAELRDIFPSMPAGAYHPSTELETGMWVHAAQALWGDDRRLHIWVTDNPTNYNKSSAARPERGRGIRMIASHINQGDDVVAHEIGHYLGLPHTFDLGGGIDPETRVGWKLSDAWDMVYKPQTVPGGTPNTFYNNRSSAAADEASLLPMEYEIGSVTNCKIDDIDAGGTYDIPGEPSGTVRCFVGQFPYQSNYDTGSGAMKGLGFAFPGQRGPNLMSYIGRWTDRGLAASQIHRIRKYLRWDVPYDSDRILDFTNGLLVPAGNLGGRRPRLGSARAPEPAEVLDFDNDGKRDIGFYVPPATLAGTGQFTVLLSTKGFSTAAGDKISVALGKVSDTPVPADYNGDGKTDIAVYGDHPTASGARWEWCPTALTPTATTCAASQTLAFGQVDDVPQFGLELDGAAGADFSVYRPRTGDWLFRNRTGTLNTSRAIGQAGAGVVPVAGLYDCDTKSDLAVYEPSTAKFKLLGSEGSWNTQVTHQFDPEFVPEFSGAGERAGAFPIGGFTVAKSCTVGGAGTILKRRAAAVFYPEDSTWNVIVNPLSTTTTVRSCVHGVGGHDQPLALDASGDMVTDLYVFKTPQTHGAASQLYGRNFSAAVPLGATTTTSWPAASSARYRAWTVGDMTGDARQEIMVWNPDNGTLRYFTSESSYTTDVSKNLGTIHAQVL